MSLEAAKGEATAPKRQKLNKRQEAAEENPETETEDDNNEDQNENEQNGDMDLLVEYVKPGSGMEPNPVKQEVLSDEEAEPHVLSTVTEDSDTEIKSECDSKGMVEDISKHLGLSQPQVMLVNKVCHVPGSRSS